MSAKEKAIGRCPYCNGLLWDDPRVSHRCQGAGSPKSGQCLHRGKVVGSVGCCEAIYECAIHGVCTLGVVHIYKTAKMPSCSKCDDKTPSVSAF
jgi:hypothetical protein